MSTINPANTQDQDATPAAVNNDASMPLLSPRSGNVDTKDHQKQKSGEIVNLVSKQPVDVKFKENMSENEERKVNIATVPRNTLRKRSYSFSDGAIKHPSLPPVKRWKAGPGRVGRGRGASSNNRLVNGPLGSKNLLPSKFLLGGNYNDPLNLNSLNDERIARVVNAVTPESSPLPTPKHRKEEYKIEVLIPPNISDPLNLNADDDSDYESKLISPLVKRKKIRHRKRPRKVITNVDVVSSKNEHLEEGNEGDISDNTDEDENVSKKSANKVTSEKETSELPVNANGDVKPEGKGEPSKVKEKRNKFQYGNYNQYYGYRNPGNIEDLRLQYFKNTWFDDKEVLDIGCNIGHITISVAKNFSPLKVVGIDIDKKLIQIANKNIKHYSDTKPDDKTIYPRAKQQRTRSFPTCLGSLNSSDGKPTSSPQPLKFPRNVEFVHGNYVLDCDQLLENVLAEYDTIMLLSTTKWIHLNFGDDGLKRVFRRIYSQLRPGGHFILEAQHFSTYKKKKKLTPTIAENFKKIKLKPENFSDYLLHEVGFCRSEVVAIPSHQSKGFQRPLQIFSKPLQSSNISNNTTPYSFGISPHCYNPSFTPFYTPGGGGFTPRPLANMETPLYSGPTPPMYYGPTPGGYSTHSTPNPAGFTPNYTPSYTPAHPGSPSYSPSYSPSGYQYSPNPGPGYSPSADAGPGFSPDPGPGYSPSADAGPGYSPDPGPGYSPSADAGPGYSPSADAGPGYSPDPGPGYSPSAGLSPTTFSPGNATPTYSPGEPAYSPSIQGNEVTGNSTPHQPDYSPSPSSSPPAGDRAAPRYSWAGDSGTGSAGNTPQYQHTPAHTPVYEGAEAEVSSCETTPQHDNENNDPATPAAAHQEDSNVTAGEEAEAEICQDFGGDKI